MPISSMQQQQLQQQEQSDCKLHQWQNVIRDSNADFQINLDPDVCRIGPKMLWIHHYLVIMSHFAKYRKNRPVNVWEMLFNHLRSPIPQWSDPNCICGSRSTSKVNDFLPKPTMFGQRLFPWSWWVTLVTEWHTDRQTDRTIDHITPPALPE